VTESKGGGLRKVELGPLFAAGVALTAYGILRRSAGAVLAGLGAIWLDQRSEFGRSLNERARAKYLTVQVVGDDSSDDVPE
jgi:hypothetical protein